MTKNGILFRTRTVFIGFSNSYYFWYVTEYNFLLYIWRYNYLRWGSTGLDWTFGLVWKRYRHIHNVNAKKLLATGERPGAGLPLARAEGNALLTPWSWTSVVQSPHFVALFNSNADKLIWQPPSVLCYRFSDGGLCLHMWRNVEVMKKLEIAKFLNAEQTKLNWVVWHTWGICQFPSMPCCMISVQTLNTTWRFYWVCCHIMWH